LGSEAAAETDVEGKRLNKRTSGIGVSIILVVVVV
jgi:hypothetical protein